MSTLKSIKNANRFLSKAHDQNHRMQYPIEESKYEQDDKNSSIFMNLNN